MVVTVVEIITTTTPKSQYFQSLRDFSGRSGCNFNFSGKIENVRNISIEKYRNINCDYKVTQTTTSTTETRNSL